MEQNNESKSVRIFQQKDAHLIDLSKNEIIQILLLLLLLYQEFT